jgi:hypothetical protein
MTNVNPLVLKHGEGVLHDGLQILLFDVVDMHAPKCSYALLKVDIAKAFNTVGWAFLIEILRHMGFSQRWTNWNSLILSTASTRILLNGNPGRRICHVRGLR